MCAGKVFALFGVWCGGIFYHREIIACFLRLTDDDNRRRSFLACNKRHKFIDMHRGGRFGGFSACGNARDEQSFNTFHLYL